MNKVSLLIMGLLIVLVGCASGDNREDIKKEYMALLTEQLEGGELINYIEGDINLVSAPANYIKSMPFYEFVLEADATDDFNNLTDEEKYKLLKELDNSYLDSFCGEDSHCNIDTFTLKAGDDSFVVSPSYGFEITMNEESFDPKPVPVQSEPSDSNSDVDKQAVYNFMKAKYDEVTNYGDSYVPETHDPLVAELAASQFGISADEAGQIYIDMEMNGY